MSIKLEDDLVMKERFRYPNTRNVEGTISHHSLFLYSLYYLQQNNNKNNLYIFILRNKKTRIKAKILINLPRINY